MSNYEILKDKIIKEVKILKELTNGCLLLCKVSIEKYGLIKDEEYKYLSFIDDDNLKLTFYNVEKYIGKFNDIFLIVGKEPMLNDVLLWHSSNSIDKYSHFEVSKGEAYFSIYDGEKTESLVWNLSKPYLKDQSSELIEWLSTLG